MPLHQFLSPPSIACTTIYFSTLTCEDHPLFPMVHSCSPPFHAETTGITILLNPLVLNLLVPHLLTTPSLIPSVSCPLDHTKTEVAALTFSWSTSLLFLLPSPSHAKTTEITLLQSLKPNHLKYNAKTTEITLPSFRVARQTQDLPPSLPMQNNCYT